MRAITRIRFKGGMLMLPSRTPYDLETVVENLEWYTARDRTVQLDVDAYHCLVEYGAVTEDTDCAHCNRARAVLTFVSEIRAALCRSCARAALASRFADWPRANPLRRAADAE